MSEVQYCTECHICPAFYHIKDTEDYLCQSCYEKFFEDEDEVSISLSEIEIKDIRLSEKEYTLGEAPVFDTVDEMLTYIYEEDESFDKQKESKNI